MRFSKDGRKWAPEPSDRVAFEQKLRELTAEMPISERDIVDYCNSLTWGTNKWGARHGLRSTEDWVERLKFFAGDNR